MPPSFHRSTGARVDRPYRVKGFREPADGLGVGRDDFTDPYDTCERGRCNHDLARAVGLAELWGDDGPFPAGVVLVRPSGSPVLFADDEEYVPDIAAEQQRWAV